MSTTLDARPRCRRFLWTAVLLGCVGCDSLRFYGQVGSGQLAVLGARQPVAELIAADDTAPDLKKRLARSREILDFAEQVLLLEVGARYSSYVELPRHYALWNVVAAPEFSVDAKTWCYPFAGCSGYRGYFQESQAHRYAQRLVSEGYDVQVAGVAAYSTLGWFNDPLMSSFIEWPLPDFAGLLFHELAHGRIYVPGDTDFNEAFATFVQRQGVVNWLSVTDAALLQDVTRRWRAEDRFARYMLGWQAQLRDLYERNYPAFVARTLKAALLAEVVSCYEAHRELFDDRYEGFFAAPLDNARFAAFAAYRQWVPAIAELFAASGGGWSEFYTRADALAELDAGQRLVELQALRRTSQARTSGDQQKAGGGDYQRADQIQCQTLTHHRWNVESTGTEHDDVRRGSDG
jgi:predicted aminopeptidase